VWGVARLKSYYKSGGNWDKMPDVMTAARAETQALRRGFPNLFAGLVTPGELGLDEEPATKYIEAEVLDPDYQQRMANATPDFQESPQHLHSTAQFRAAMEEIDDAEPEPEAKPAMQERVAAPPRPHTAPASPANIPAVAGPAMTVKEFIAAITEEFHIDAGQAMKHLNIRSLQGVNLRDALATLRTHLNAKQAEGKPINAEQAMTIPLAGGPAVRRYFDELAERAGYSPLLAFDEFRRVVGSNVNPTPETNAKWQEHLEARITAKERVESGQVEPDHIDVDGPLEDDTEAAFEEFKGSMEALADGLDAEVVEAAEADPDAPIPFDLKKLDTTKKRGPKGRLN
jgi:hypothetical protein